MITLSQIQKIQIPQNSGVYIFKNRKKTILYVGKAKNLKKRVGQYFTPGSVWKQDMISQADNIERIETKSEKEALFLEENLIKEHQPEYNRLLKNNTQYVYIKFTRGNYPQISIVRKKTGKNNIFVGPKNHTKSLKKFLAYINNFYKLRDCNQTTFKKGKFCTKYDFGLCDGWCGTKTLQKKSKSDVFYQKIIKKVIAFFQGKTNFIKKDLLTEIEKSIETQNFERANQLKEFYLELNNRVDKQTVVINKDISGIVCQISNIKTNIQNNQNLEKKSGFYVFSILKIIDGKIIDIIRGKEFIDEIRLETLVQNIENEFDTKLKKETDQIQDTFVFQSLNKSLSKTDDTEIKNFLSNSIQSYIASDSFQENSILNDILQNIQKKYFLKNFPYKIECLDISHFQGDRTSGGLSCMIGGLKYPKGYRRYKIKTAKNNDYKSIQEVLVRRFDIEKTDSKNDYPDLFIIDGGKGQLNILKKVLLSSNKFIDIFSKVDFVSLGKGEARDKNKIDKNTVENIYFFDKDFSIIEIPMNYDESDKLLTKIRDESHRFANLYRKKLMQQERKS